MKIELKNIKFYESMSEETNCFQANVYIDGKKVAFAENQGHGGNTNIRPERGCEDIIAKAEKYCETLPERVVSENFSYKIDLEALIDDLLFAYLTEKDKQKFKKKLEKDCEKGICYSTDDNSYRMYYWKNYTMAQLVSTPVGLELLKKNIQKLKGEGYKILNTNLPKDIL